MIMVTGILNTIIPSFLLKSFYALMYQRQISGVEICQRLIHCHGHSLKCLIRKILQADCVIRLWKILHASYPAVKTPERVWAVSTLELGASGDWSRFSPENSLPDFSEVLISHSHKLQISKQFLLLNLVSPDILLKSSCDNKLSEAYGTLQRYL